MTSNNEGFTRTAEEENLKAKEPHPFPVKLNG